MIVFDKTGTLTAGKPNVTMVTPCNSSGMDADTILRLAATVERNTTHPVAQVSRQRFEDPLSDWIIDGDDSVYLSRNSPLLTQETHPSLCCSSSSRQLSRQHQ